MPKTTKSPRTVSRTRKPARTRTPIGRSDASRIARDGRDRRGSCLPFTVIRSADYAVFAPIPRTYQMDDWPSNQAAVAEASLVAGYQLALPVAIEAVAYVAAAVARSLKRRLYMGYDVDAEMLCVWIDEDEIEGEIDEDPA